MEDSLVKINIEKCVLCYACVRNCPVKAIAVSSKEETPIKVIYDRCVGCGACYEVCPYDAVEYTSDIDKTQHLLKKEKNLIALLAPSVAGEFLDITDYRKFSQMLRQMGFNKVYEAAFGADLVAQEYKKLFKESKGKYFLTTNCPVVVSNVEKFQPDLKENLAPIVSPWIAMVKHIESEYDKACKIVYITPCIAAKQEAKKYQNEVSIAAVITFEELRKMLSSSGLDEKNLSYAEFDGPIANKGYLYPISNGLVQMMDETEDLSETKVITCEGHVDFVNSLRNFNEDVNEFKSHLNIFYCNGCSNGPAAKKSISKFIKQKKIVEFAKKRHQKFDESVWLKNIKKHSQLNLSTSFTINDQRIATPSDEKIQSVLQIIGKEDMDTSNGCGACGYENCREFSIAVSKGLAEPEMCFTYNKRKSIETIKELQKANEILKETKEELEISKKEAMEDKLAMEEAHRITHNMLQELPSALVIVDKQLKVVQANKVLIDLLGKDAKEIAEVIPGLLGADLKGLIPFEIQKLFSFVLKSGENILNRDILLNGEIYTLSIFVIKKGEIAGAVFRNLQQPEIQKEQVIGRITDVIDKNLEMVQKIGFLLGEGAAETEQMLNSILQSYKQSLNKENQAIQINPLNKK